MSADWVPLLKLNHGSVNLGTERLVCFDSLNAAVVSAPAGAPVSAVSGSGELCDVIMMQDRLIVVLPSGKSVMVCSPSP